MHSTLEAIVKLALSASSGKNLSLNYQLILAFTDMLGAVKGSWRRSYQSSSRRHTPLEGFWQQCFSV